ncbi:hypothetical protein CC1G_09472 [Coprinopsis cinerea okayama7|uniref:F-box domain-containing protein n=1 Tax=Coprinopsis cinerea (strain Okayama-7 / 130 / ATCC MYA-4618 / FGSC 9003) TaxID=240176 RepID=A8PDF3_COPC7|nr:hypothetical protein CC1G_09472 [Coprinopsis cinerea okayama7\|eukprot:XP_001840588.1 hypothetical protein CC1G_09472 [Coprinopsis cinerea okayama7\
MSSLTICDPRNEVLSNDDLLDVIFQLIFYDDPERDISPNMYSPRHQLLHLALTCKAFLNPALNVLWSVLPRSLEPLIQLLPGFTADRYSYTVNDIITSPSWEKLMAYGSRVKSITFPDDSRVMDLDLYQRISHHSTSLLPRVQSLTVRCRNLIDPRAPSLAIGPSLQRVNIRLARWVPHTILTDLLGDPSRLPNIKTVEIEGGECQIIPPELSVVFNLKSVAALSLDFAAFKLSPVILNDAARLPLLSSLSISSLATNAINITTTKPNAPMTFPSLTNLELGGNVAGLAQTLSQFPSNTKVKYIHLRLDKESDIYTGEGEWSRHMALSFQHTAERFGAITTVEVTDSSGRQLSLPILRPLLSIRGLQHLRLQFTSFTGTDDLINKIAHSFPDLVTLVLPASPGKESPTVECLWTLANACPKLEDLRMCIKLGFVAFNYTATNHPLRSLHIRAATDRPSYGRPSPPPLKISTHITIATFLDTVFPNLLSIGNYSEGEDGYSSSDTVEGMVQLITALKNARKSGAAAASRQCNTCSSAMSID